MYLSVKRCVGKEETKRSGLCGKEKVHAKSTLATHLIITVYFDHMFYHNVALGYIQFSLVNIPPLGTRAMLTIIKMEEFSTFLKTRQTIKETKAPPEISKQVI